MHIKLRNSLWIALTVSCVLLLCAAAGGYWLLTTTPAANGLLADRLEEAFNDQYEGRLEVGSLSGIPARSLVAEDVRLYDPAGRPVAAADSAVLSVSLGSIFTPNISIAQLILHQPSAVFERRDGGRWNIQEALRPKKGARSRGRRIHIAYLEVRNGHIRTSSSESGSIQPVNLQRFDYTNTTIPSINFVGSFRTAAGMARLSIEKISAALPELGTAIRGSGLLVLDDGRVSLSNAEVSSEGSEIKGSFAFRPSDGQISVSLDSSTVSFDEWKPLAPGLPLQKTARISLAAHGHLSALRISRFRIARKNSYLTARGTIDQAPEDSARRNFVGRLSAGGSSIRALTQLLPDSLLPAAVNRHDSDRPFSVATNLDGTFRRGAFAVRGGVDGDIWGGAIDGSYTIDRIERGAVAIDSRLVADSVDIAAVIPRREAPLIVSGPVRVSSEAPKGAELTVDTRLTGPVLASYGFTDVSMQVVPRADGHLEVTAGASQQGGGHVSGRMTIHSGTSQPSALAVEGMLELRQMDFGRLKSEDPPRTEITATATFSGSGSSWRDARGHAEVTFDSSAANRGGMTRHIQPAELDLALSTDGKQSRIAVDGNILRGSIGGAFTLPDLVGAGRDWLRRVEASVHNSFDKPLPGTGRPAGAVTARQRATHTADEYDAIDVTGRFSLLGRDVISAFVPDAPALASDASFSFSLTADQSKYSLDAAVQGDSLRWNGYSVRRFTGRIEAAPDSWQVAVAGASARWHQQMLDTLAIHGSYIDRRGSLSVETGTDGPLQLAADWSLLADRNRLNLKELAISHQGTTWRHEGTSRIDIFSNGYVTPRLALIPEQAPREDARVTLRGTLSENAGDTLHVRGEALALRSLTRIFPRLAPFTGRVTGSVAIAGGLSSPRASGQMRVSDMAYDGRLLGDLTLESRYLPDSSAAAVSLKMRPPEAPAGGANESTPGAGGANGSTQDAGGVDGSAERAAPLALTAEGIVRLPHAADPAGALDLQMHIRRGDVFFLEYPPFSKLVANPRGHFSGDVTVSGTFRRPIFTGSLHLAPTTFDVPDFNVSYTAQGPFSISRSGLHFSDLNLSDEGDGTAAVAGDLLFNDYEGISFDLRADLSNLMVMDLATAGALPFYGEIWGSGDFSLNGPVHDARLRSTNARTHRNSEVFIPLEERQVDSDAGFIRFETAKASAGDTLDAPVRDVEEKKFLKGLNLDLNISAHRGTTVHLVMDPLLGETISARGYGRLQLVRRDGSLSSFGTLNVSGGEYLFSAGELFMRRLLLEQGGAISWDGALTNPVLDLTAYYETRASTAGLFNAAGRPETLPLIVYLNVADRLSAPQLQVSLAVDRASSTFTSQYAGIDALLNQPEHVAEYATSVLLTNSFLLTTSLPRNQEAGFSETRNQLAFNSLSQLITGQINRYLSVVIPNLQLNLGVQRRSVDELGLSYGLALHLLDERLIIRGSGTYQNEEPSSTQQNLEGELIVEVRLHPNVSVQAYYRRQNALLESDLTNTTGAGLSYRAEFPTWRRFFSKIFGWLLPATTLESTHDPSADDALPPDGETTMSDSTFAAPPDSTVAASRPPAADFPAAAHSAASVPAATVDAGRTSRSATSPG